MLLYVLSVVGVLLVREVRFYFFTLLDNYVVNALNSQSAFGVEPIDMYSADPNCFSSNSLRKQD